MIGFEMREAPERFHLPEGSREWGRMGAIGKGTPGPPPEPGQFGPKRPWCLTTDSDPGKEVERIETNSFEGSETSTRKGA